MTAASFERAAHAALAVLMAESAIRRALAEYAQACDDGRFDDLAGLLAPDAELLVRGATVARGREVVRDWVAAAQPPHRRGRHMVANAVVDVTDPAGPRAAAVSRADFVFFAFGPDGPAPSGTGRYLDRFVPAPPAEGHGGTAGLPARWLLARREMVMLP